jgi:hypothetical protein
LASEVQIKNFQFAAESEIATFIRDRGHRLWMTPCIYAPTFQVIMNNLIPFRCARQTTTMLLIYIHLSQLCSKTINCQKFPVIVDYELRL